MKIEPDDPRLTAYALGELDEVDAADAALAVEQSPECRRAVEEIRATANWLRIELKNEPCPKIAVVVQPENEPKTEADEKIVPFSNRKIAAIASIAALAACVLFGFILPNWWNAQKKTPQLLAKNEAQPRLETEAVPAPTPTPVAKTDALTVTAQESKPVPPTTPAPEVSLAIAGPPTPESLSLPQISSPSSAQSSDRLGRSLREKENWIMQRDGMLPLPPSTAIAGDAAENPVTSLAIVPAKGKGGVDSYSVNSVKLAEMETLSRRPAGADAVQERSRMLRRYGTMLSPIHPSSDTALYEKLEENAFLPARENPLSTFSIDVDTASYANVRRFLNQGTFPPEGAVRVEELLNYFSYDYPAAKEGEPFSVNTEVADCPWNPGHRLVRIGLKGRELAQAKRPPSNFVFLIDVSGSMQPTERLPLIKQALQMLVRKLTPSDRVAIVVYAGTSGLVLPSTSCAHKEKILAAIDALESGGSTNGGEGIQLAYATATENFIKGGVNRVILCTDGDFNVGITSQDSLVRLIEDKARSGVFLSALGVGTDNFKDSTMQKLADKGNGNYHYLDTLYEAQKVLIEQMNGTLVAIAKDVKIQIEFNPARVSAYRLIGYEKRRLRAEDFNDDKKDAGEIGAGHTVTALYEIVPPGGSIKSPGVDPLKYQTTSKPEKIADSNSKELLTLKLRYKQPDGDTSKLLEYPVTDGGRRYSQASEDFKFAAAVASFGMLLRDSEHKGNSRYETVLELAEEGKGKDEFGYRSEFLNLVQKAKQLRSR